jgi:hypothetical protein
LEKIYIKSNGFTVSLDADFCGTAHRYFIDLEADCKDDNPEIECSCCTICCAAEGTDCSEPVIAPSEAPIRPTQPPAQAEARFATLTQMLEPVSGSEPFQDFLSSQYKAAMWMASQDPAVMDFETESFDAIVQRYLMALIYYGAQGPNWTNTHSWLSADDICNWNDSGGVWCNDVGLVTELDLGKWIEGLGSRWITDVPLSSCFPYH